MSVPRHRRAFAALALASGLACATGCGGSAPHPSAAIPGPQLRVAVMPFDNLSDQGAAGETMTLVFFTAVGAHGGYEPVEPGLLASLLDSMRVRPTTALTAEQIREIGRRLDAPRLFLGTVLEAGSVRTDDGEVPAIGATVKLIDTQTARVLWTRMGFKTGADKETVFGWGRERSRPRLAAQLAEELVRQLPLPGDSTFTSGGSR